MSDPVAGSAAHGSPASGRRRPTRRQPTRRPPRLRAKVCTVSDGVVAGIREDRSGAAVAERLEEAGYEVVERRVVADGVERWRPRSRTWRRRASLG